MGRKITLFELHFDGASFGPSFGSDSDREGESVEIEDEYGEEEHEERSSGSKLRPLLAVVGVVVLVTAARRLMKRRSGEDEYGIEIDEESEGVATEQ